jgi:outer membrane biosynthesis protein TonB
MTRGKNEGKECGNPSKSGTSYCAKHQPAKVVLEEEEEKPVKEEKVVEKQEEKKPEKVEKQEEEKPVKEEKKPEKEEKSKRWCRRSSFGSRSTTSRSRRRRS